MVTAEFDCPKLSTTVRVTVVVLPTGNGPVGSTHSLTMLPFELGLNE